MKKHRLYELRHSTDGCADFSSMAAREDTVRTLLENASLERRRTELYWQRMKRYYDGAHDIVYQTDGGEPLPFKPACSPDGFIHVESQIEPDAPSFEFSPRGSYPYEAAKKRETLTELICDLNDLSAKNTVNERRLGIYGSALFKVGWDAGAGEVTVETPRLEGFYPDPAATELDGCEYIMNVSYMHASRAARVFAEELAAFGEDIASCLSSDVSGIMNGSEQPFDADTVTVTECWFRQPCAGKAADTLTGQTVSFAAGDIALSVFLNGKEIRYIPKYWQNTDAKCYPFVLYTKVPNVDALFGKSELEPIIPLIDAADRELYFAQYNAAFTSNDIILAEENAFSDDTPPSNVPGAVWRLRPGMMGKVQRMGNLASHEAGQLGNYARWQTMMQQTTGNFDISQGMEPARVTTASGIALLNERAGTRKALKNRGKAEGFKRLYRLIDRTALEFYPKGRNVERDGEAFVFDRCDLARDDGYIPELDVKIHIGDATEGSKAFTVSAMSALIEMPIHRDNYLFVKAYAELIGLPMRKEIGEYLDRRFASAEQDASEDERISLQTLLAGILSEEPEKEREA